MDVVIRDPGADEYIAFRALERMPECAELPPPWRTQLEVHAGVFTASVEFWFDQPILDAFIAGLETIAGGTGATATLQTRYEEPRVVVRGGRHADVSITGFLMDYSRFDQHLHFSIYCSRAAIGPAARELRRISDALPLLVVR